MPIGFQGYDARFLLIKDWDQGWATMRNIGFQSVDLVSFKGYGYEKSALADMPATQIRQKLDSIGMLCDNCQFYYAELHQSFEEKMAFSHELRLKNIICAPDPTRMKTTDDWKWQAAQLNDLGAKVKQAGFRLGYHNHDQEFMPIDGVMPYDLLMEGRTPSWSAFKSMSAISLSREPMRWVTSTNIPLATSPCMPKTIYRGKTSVPVGQGVLKWKEIFKAAKKTPIENYYAEVAAYGAGTLHGVPANAWPTDSIDQLRQSYVYLHSLRV